MWGKGPKHRSNNGVIIHTEGGENKGGDWWWDPYSVEYRREQRGWAHWKRGCEAMSERVIGMGAQHSVPAYWSGRGGEGSRLNGTRGISGEEAS